jgi:hypothetical protein
MPRKTSSRQPASAISRVALTRPSRAALGAVPSKGEVISALTKKMRRKEYLHDSEIQLLRNAGVKLTKPYVTMEVFLNKARWHAARYEKLVGIEAGVYVSNLFEPWIVMEEGDEFDNVKVWIQMFLRED